MRFESGSQAPKKQHGWKETILGASALVSANALNAEELPYNSAPTYEISKVYVAPESNDVDDFSKIDREFKNEVDLENLPTPASVVETLTIEQMAVFQKGVDRFKEYAANDPEEHFAVFLIKKDGSVDWVDKKILVRESFGNDSIALKVISAANHKIEADVVSVIRIHSHPSKTFESFKDMNESARESVPPSTIDILGSLSSAVSKEGSSGYGEDMVVTEEGLWRFGIKSHQAAESFRVLSGIGIDEFEKIDDPKMYLQAEIFSQKIYEIALEEGLGQDELIKGILISLKDIDLVKDRLQNDLSFLISMVRMVDFMEASNDFEDLGIQDFTDLIHSVYKKKQIFYKNISPGADLKTLAEFASPDNDSNGAKEDGRPQRVENFAGNWDTYINNWKQFGVYIEKIETVQN